jgi:hypothetical protein
LVKAYRNSFLFFEKYSKLNKELELDAKNIIKCSFKESLAFLSKKMTIFALHMILGKYKKIFQWKPYFSLQIRKEHELCGANRVLIAQQKSFLKFCKKMTFFGMVKNLTNRQKIDIFQSFLNGIHYFFYVEYSKLNKGH